MGTEETGDLAQTGASIDALFADAPVGIALVDVERRFVQLNPALERMMGKSREQVLGRTLAESLAHDGARAAASAAAVEAVYDRVLESGQPVGDYQLASAVDPSRHFSLSIFPVAGVGEGLCLISLEITHRVEREWELSHAATHDGLTGLPNRELLLDRLGHANERLGRHGGRLGILFCDVDGLKPINDAFGHESGDRLLKAVAERLRGVVRTEDTLARYGGDEFVVLVEDLPSAAHLDELARRAGVAVHAPLVLDDAIVEPSLAIGAATTDVRESPEDLLRRADEAMYAKKRRR